MSTAAAAFQAVREDARDVPPSQGATPSEERLLAVAGRLYRPGDVVHPSRMANEMGCTSARISQLTTSLRAKGLWPYEACGPGNHRIKAAPSAEPEYDPAEVDARKARLAELKDAAAKRTGRADTPISVADLDQAVPDDRSEGQRKRFGDPRKTPESPEPFSAIRALVRGEAPPSRATAEEPARKPRRPRITARALADAESLPDLRAPDPDVPVIRNTDPKADPELLVIHRVLAQLGRLPTWASRQRVLKYLDDRMTEEEPVET